MARPTRALLHCCCTTLFDSLIFPTPLSHEHKVSTTSLSINPKRQHAPSFKPRGVSGASGSASNSAVRDIMRANTLYVFGCVISGRIFSMKKVWSS